MGGMFVRGEGGDVTGYTVTVNICRGFLGIGAVTSVTSVTPVTAGATEGNEVIHRGLRGASGGSPRPRLNNSGNRIR